MKLVYTDIRSRLTDILAKEAADLAQAGKRVFYIAPNSLSFEKERAVLERLDGQATFSILVTRFAQMARYFTLHQAHNQDSLDDIGLAMLFYRVLAQFDDAALKVYGRLKQDMAFIQQLVGLYQDMQAGNLTVEDLAAMEDPDKQADLQAILRAFLASLSQENAVQTSKIQFFTQQVLSGSLDKELADVVVIVDGFTRFSAEEEALVVALHGRVADIVIGVYASQRAYQATYIEGNVYEAAVTFLRELAQTFATKPIYVSQQEERDGLGKISSNMESLYDYSQGQQELTEADKSRLTIWEVPSSKEELEQVAASIRQKVAQGYRYQDILVLLGDVESYRLQLGTIFDKYEIPYYLGQAEAMSAHPLVHVVESLERIKRYRFRAEDVLNLVKSGLIGSFEQAELDQFEQYVRYAEIKGQKAFSQPFTINRSDRYDLERLNAVRSAIIDPLVGLFAAKKQAGQGVLTALLTYLERVALPENMAALSAGENERALEKEEQVWKAFVHVLEQVQRVFGSEKLDMAELLTLLKAGMQASSYRTVPATVDVVRVRSYDLVEPHAAPLVYALGLSASHFPKTVKNKSLLTEDERVRINEAVGKTARFDLVERTNLMKNHAAMLSLFNSAREHLVLSAPQVVNDAADSLSPYLKALKDMGIAVEQKWGRTAQASLAEVGHSKALLSRLVEMSQLQESIDWSKEEETFWAVMARYLRKELAEKGLSLPILPERITPQPLAEDTLASLYPAGEPLKLSASSLTDFYRNQYLYFIKHVLRLQEQESIRPDARSHGNFLHRIFEKSLASGQWQGLDQLEIAIRETQAETAFQALYGTDEESKFSKEILLEIARATATVLAANPAIQFLEQEAGFSLQGDKGLLLPDGREVQIRGKIDRLDALLADGARGIVDYKSGENRFQLDKFYNGLSPQLMTYVAALSAQEQAIFGAMYLHMLDPLVKLSDVAVPGQVLDKAQKQLVYKGLFVAEESDHLGDLYQTSKATLFSQAELELLLAHNQELYQQAAQTILSGNFAVNPYTEDGLTVAGDQLKNLTGFEANRHLGQARRLVKGGTREEWLDRMKKGEA